MAYGVHRTLQSKEWLNVVAPALRIKYPLDMGKLDKVVAGTKSLTPANDLIRGLWEEVKLHPLQVTPSSDWGLWEKPVVMLHGARGGVEYVTEQKAMSGSATLDLNSADPWDTYIQKANAQVYPTTFWRHCHTYEEIQVLLNVIAAHPKKTGGLNLESVGWEGLSIPRIADMIDATLGTNSILYIPTLGWVDGVDWSAMNRHVFGLEFFLNDPPTYPDGTSDWAGLSDLQLAQQLGEHARDCGIRKLNYLCGIYPAPQNPNARERTPAQYKETLRQAGERFGGIYLGDNYSGRPEMYAQWI